MPVPIGTTDMTEDLSTYSLADKADVLKVQYYNQICAAYLYSSGDATGTGVCVTLNCITKILVLTSFIQK